MTLDLILLQIIAISCFAILLRSRKNPGWAMVSLGILSVVSIGWFLKAPWTAWVGGLLWAIGIVLPIQGMAQIGRLRSQEKYVQARKVALLVRLLHPGDGWWSYPKMLQAQALAQRGDRDRSLRILEPLQSIETYDGRLAIAAVHQLQAQWTKYLQFAETQLPLSVRLEESSSAGLYLRSLGETRQMNQLLDAVKEVHLRARKTGNTALVHQSRLYAFAFTGQTDDLKRLLATHLNALSPKLKQFWIATAQWCAGDFHQAKPEFEDLLANTSDCELRSSLQWRSQQAPLRTFDLLTIEARQTLLRLQTLQQEDLQYNPRTPLTHAQQAATRTIIGLNLLVYIAPLVVIAVMPNLDVFIDAASIPMSSGLERVGRAIVTIYQWGALVPDQFFAGSWWQPLTAMFMHDPSGIAHIVLNMLGLAIVGSFVESRLGMKRFLMAYFGTGLGSMVILSVLARLADSGTMSAIGASGAIMGMIGVMAAIYWQGWRKGDQVAKHWLRSIGIIIALQTVFDVLNPQVSMTGHLAGLGLGLVIGGLLVQRGIKTIAVQR